jgi:hypothetical protein
VIRRGARCGWPVPDAEKRARICGKPATCERTVDGIPFTMCDACAARYDAAKAAKEKEKERPERLDFGDPAAVRAYFKDLRVVIEDAESVAEDMLAPIRKRTLGHAKQRQLYREARTALRQLLDYADPQPLTPSEPSDPAGSPGH